MHSNLDSKFDDFRKGLTTPLRVARLLLDHPRLFVLFILPVTITLIVIAGVIYSLLAGLSALWTPLLASWTGAYSGFLGGLLGLLAGAVLIGFAFLSMGVCVAWISSPFNDRLALETEKALGVNAPDESFSVILRGVWLDLKKTFCALAALLLLALFGLLPGIGLLSWLGLALVQTFVYLSYPLNRRQAGIREGCLWILSRPGRSLGFGISTLVFFAIPVLNLFALPFAVIGGTLNFLESGPIGGIPAAQK